MKNTNLIIGGLTLLVVILSTFIILNKTKVTKLESEILEYKDMAEKQTIELTKQKELAQEYKEMVDQCFIEAKTLKRELDKKPK